MFTVADVVTNVPYSPATIIRSVVIYAEGLFDGESHVV